MLKFLFKKNEVNFSKKRSSHLRCSIKIDFLKNFAKFTGNKCASLFFKNIVFNRAPLVAASVKCFYLNFFKKDKCVLDSD